MLYSRIYHTVPGNNGQPTPAPGETLIGGVVPSSATGAFTASGLPVGNYVLCASVPSEPYLDPCQWASPIIVAVSANATSTHNIAVAKGVFLNVEVNDALGLVPATQVTSFQRAKLLVGIYYANSAYLGLPTTEAVNGIHGYKTVIPTGVPLSLWLFSKDVGVTDVNGNPVALSTGSLIPFQATAGQDQAFTFAVSGPAAATSNSIARRK